MIVALAIVLFVVSLFFLLRASVHYPPDDAVLFLAFACVALAGGVALLLFVR